MCSSPKMPKVETPVQRQATRDPMSRSQVLGLSPEEERRRQERLMYAAMAGGVTGQGGGGGAMRSPISVSYGQGQSLLGGQDMTV